MKNVLEIFILLIFLLIWGCGDEAERKHAEQEFSDFLELMGVSQNSYSSERKTIKLKLKASSAWKLLIESVNENWISVDKKSGEATRDNSIEILMTIEANTEESERKANIYLENASGLKKCYSVIQKAADQAVFGLKGIKQDDFYPAEEITVEVELTASSNWTLSANQRWLSFNITEGGETNGYIPIFMTIGSNKNYSVRKALITLKSNDGKNERNYWITQQASVFEIEDSDNNWIGGPNAMINSLKFDEGYPQMREWAKAGVEGGIPLLSEQAASIAHAFVSGTSAADIQKVLDANKDKKDFVILLQNGEYYFDNRGIKLYGGQTLLGESRDGVKINVANAQISPVIDLKDAQKAGVRRLSIVGTFRGGNPGPMDNWQVISGGDGKQVVINMRGNCRNSFVDDVYLKNSASHPICVGGSHNTVRATEVDGAWNKGGGFQGYFYIGGEYALITGCKVVNLRHFSMQDPSSKYNVIYGNDLTQEVSFHNNDGGNNLVERNKITIPNYFTDRPPFLGPWSTQHKVGPENYIYGNVCSDPKYDSKHGGNNKWSDNTKVFVGPKYVTSGGVPTSGLERCYNNFPDSGRPVPHGGTFYPVEKK